MKSRERVAAAMRREPVDRVPVMCQLALGHYFLNTPIPAMDIWHSSEAFGDALLRLQQRYHFDGILVNLPGRDPDWHRHVRRIEERGRDRIITWGNGWTTVCPADDNPHVYCENGLPNRIALTQVDPSRLFYIEPHDLTGIKYPFTWGFSQEPPDPQDFFPPWHYDTVDYVIRKAGGEISIHGEVFSPFTQLLELLGYTDALMALLDDPGKCKVCLEALSQGAAALGRGLASHGVDAILISSAFAGAGFISPKHYREFVLPYEKRVIEGIRQVHDLPLYTHTCGRIGDRLELMEATGTNGLDTLDPPPLGDLELADAKQRVGGRLFLKGNLDPVNIILQGSPEMVYENAMSCLRVGAAGGGYILSSACSVPPHAPPENIEMLFQAAEAACGETS